MGDSCGYWGLPGSCGDHVCDLRHPEQFCKSVHAVVVRNQALPCATYDNDDKCHFQLRAAVSTKESILIYQSGGLGSGEGAGSMIKMGRSLA